MTDTHHVAGTVKQDGSSVSREIRVIDASDGALLATAESTGGTFDIGLTSADPVFVQAIPAEGYRPLIKGPLVPQTLGDPLWDDVHALLHFEDGDGSTTVADEKDGTWIISGSLSEVTTDRAKFGSGSFLSNGSNAALRLANPPALAGDFTVEWFGAPVQGHQTSGRVFQTANGDVLTGFSMIVDSGTITAPLKLYATSPGGSAFDLVSGETIIATPTADQFYHFAWQRIGSTMQLFVEGIEAHSWTNAGAISMGSEWVWGGQTVGTSRNAGWAVDEARITDGEARYPSGGFTPPAEAFKDF